MFDTIVAISTGLTNQPISIIRLSGPEAFNIVKEIFSGKTGKDKTITYGLIKESHKTIDEVLISWFKAPNTFTGEDIVEINAHGGIVNTNKILELCLTNGARIAERGEFSRRAFLNGKMDLIKAEAIHDLIFAKTEKAANLAVNKFDGQTSEYIKKLKDNLLEIIATIETNIDYPEYNDVMDLTNNHLLPKLKHIEENLKETVELSKNSKYISEGIKTVIVGRPNAGKSSLLNTLIEEDKAIVTDTPGTTRDIVEGTFQVNGILIKLIDTAGIRSSTNEIENIGIKKSFEQIEKADLVIHLIDSNAKETHNDQEVEEMAKSKFYIKIFTKSDLSNQKKNSISVKNNDISVLIDKIKHIIPHINLNDNKIIINARQQSLVRQAYNSILEAINSLRSGFLPDEVIIDIRKAWEDLTNITGKADNEKLLDEMFRNFCLGK